MLTPSKIMNHHFEVAGKNAYRAHSVDEFFDIVAESYEQMFKENGELVKKISILAERLEEYKNDEDNIR
ncbi:MAG: DivIVA domain-containing protein, partial [Clostridia bacterium]|nr:DivIVA domain-containing protein [Clostridia bacterium]